VPIPAESARRWLIPTVSGCVLAGGLLSCGKLGDTEINGVSQTERLARIEISLSSDSVLIGDTLVAVARGVTGSGQPTAVPALLWRSTDSSVAVVGANGVLRARNSGEVTLTASSNGTTAVRTVLVRSRPLRVRVTSPDSISLLDEPLLRVEVSTTGGLPLPEAGPRVLSRDTSIVSVRPTNAGSATLSPKVPGTTELLIVIGADSVRQRVTVRQVSYRSVTLRVMERTLLTGDSVQIQIGAIDSTGREVLPIGTTLAIEPAGAIQLRNGWVVGASTGAAILRVTHGTLSARDTVHVQTPSVFPLQLIDGNEQTPIALRVRNSMERATARWKRVLRAPTESEAVNLPARACRNSVPIVRAIAGLVVVVTLDTLPRNVAARAGPCLVRQSSGLPLVGSLSLNLFLVPTFTDEKLDDVITHEVGHVLGIGTIWNKGKFAALIDGDSLSVDPVFRGVNAVRSFDLLGQSDAFAARRIPVQIGILGHWRAGPLGGELMGPILTASRQPLSAVTMGVLEDLGWTVDRNGYEDYTLTPSIVARLGTGGTTAQIRAIGPELEDQLLLPAFVQTRSGQLFRAAASGAPLRQ
jgi:hypothetical protein